MKSYPSILGPYPNILDQQLNCYAFYKYDGSNLRFEWNKKLGWYKFGTRRRLFDATDHEYGVAVEIFKNKYAEFIESKIKEFRVDSLIAFCEFFGPHSFGGQHDPSHPAIYSDSNDPKNLVLFDVNLHKKGFIDPANFIETFGDVETPKLVYQGPFNKKFVEDVRENKLATKLFEGVVCKGGTGHKLWMRKVKTHRYMAELQKRFGKDWEKHWE